MNGSESGTALAKPFHETRCVDKIVVAIGAQSLVNLLHLRIGFSGLPTLGQGIEVHPVQERDVAHLRIVLADEIYQLAYLFILASAAFLHVLVLDY